MDMSDTVKQTAPHWRTVGYQAADGALHCPACAAKHGTADPDAAVCELDLDVARDFGQGPDFKCDACGAGVK
jgi:hypothetical protein